MYPQYRTHHRLILSAVLALAPLSAWSGPYTQTFLQIEGGVNRYIGPEPTPFRCSVGGPDGSTAGTLFPTAGSSKTDGNANCSIGGVQRLTTDPTPGTDVITDTASYSARFNGALFSATTTARSGSGIVGASASVNFPSGFTNNQTVDAALAFGAFGETLTIDGAAGTGWVVFGFDIDGTLMAKNGAAMEAVYRTPTSGGTRRLVSGSAGRGYNGQGLFDPAAGNQRAPGFPVTATADPVPTVTVSGRQTFSTVALPFAFGLPFDFEFGLIAGAYEFDGTSEALFSSTARLSAVHVYTQTGRLLDNPTIDTASGARWTTQGLQAPDPGPVNPVPLPGTAALLVAGLAAAAGLRRRPPAIN